MKQKTKHLLLGVLLLTTSLSSVLISSPYSFAKCGGVDTSIINCSQTGSGKNISNSGLWGLLLLVINILTAGIGIAAVGGIIYGSILYAGAGGSADQVKKARTIITNVVIGIIAYALMYSFLNFIIPGGLFT